MENDESDEIVKKYQESYNKAYKWAKRFALVGLAAILLQISSNIAAGINNQKLYATPRYSCIEALTMGFEVEKKKLGLEDETMYLEIVSKPKFTGECLWNKSDNAYTIKIGYDHMTKGTLKHEMFHAKRIKERKPKSLRIWLNGYEEWLATSYALKEDN